ncbi:MAG: TlpA family protein disulfide reductase [Flavobacteriales bacterium]|nr:Thiol-disulfide oxidoreductase ResA [Flavobacteriales bacterium]MCC6576512.1 TlpA family protein disulfide reductase [Flavobacteriales bacterium]NUQ15747.1 TlpA family protein disulfide reductase [Flavobacteriales bacterium]
MAPRSLLFPLVAALAWCGCTTGVADHPTLPRTGPWRMALDLNGQELPFLFDLHRDSGAWRLVVHNGEERIAVDDIVLMGDSIRVRMPLFDSEFRGHLPNDSTITGHWHNHLKGPDYRIAFVARAGGADRFTRTAKPTGDLSGQWRTRFSPGAPDGYDALGLFVQQHERLTGTFGTETGDYRFLEGVMDGDSLKLSCFDGSHAFLFKALLRHDSLLGRYWSGTHWQEPWVAVRDPAFRLRDPDSLTFLKEGHAMVDFRFPSIDGGNVSPKDPRFAGKVLMVQVMGSWCPNCVDETRLLDELYGKYRSNGLEVIAIAFEKYEDEARSLAALRHFRDRLQVKYPIVYAGNANKEVASAKLPFLDHVMSYPTCIFIDRGGRVRRIRTGFYGPGTGEHYTHYKRNLERFLQDLLAEEAPAL